MQPQRLMAPVSGVQEEEGYHPVFIRYKDVVATTPMSIEVIRVSFKPSLISHPTPPTLPLKAILRILTKAFFAYTMFSREDMFHLETAFTMNAPETETPLPADEIEAQASDSDSDISISSNADSLASSTTVALPEEASFMPMEIGLYEHFLFSPDTNSGKSTSSSKTASRSSTARKTSWFSWGSRPSK